MQNRENDKLIKSKSSGFFRSKSRSDLSTSNPEKSSKSIANSSGSRSSTPRSDSISPKLARNIADASPAQYSSEQVLEASKHVFDNIAGVPAKLESICNKLLKELSYMLKQDIKSNTQNIPDGTYHFSYQTQTGEFTSYKSTVNFVDADSLSFVTEIKNGKIQLYWLNKNHVFGEGAFGKVIAGHYVAEHHIKPCKTNFHAPHKSNAVAVKVCANNNFGVNNFANVLNKITSNLNHCNLLVTQCNTDIDSTDGQFIQLMAFIEGPSLTDFLYKIDPNKSKSDESYIVGKRYIQPEKRINLFYQTISSLHHFHTKFEMIHRDIKLDNGIVNPCDDDSFVVTLIDVDDAVDKNQKVNQAGTIGWIPQDVWEDSSSFFDQHSDRWALGVILSDILSGYTYGKENIELQICKYVRGETNANTSFNELDHALPDIYLKPNIVIMSELLDSRNRAKEFIYCYT